MEAEHFIEGLQESRKLFLKHLQGMPDEAWDFKPFPACMSVTESLAHMIVNDRMAVEALKSQKEPNYDAARQVIAPDIPKGKDHLLTLLAKSHQELVDTLYETVVDQDEEFVICIWGWKKPAFQGIPYLSSEDFYHSGQVSFIRQAVDPDWDYYAAIYGD